jgi:hypothetical protein
MGADEFAEDPLVFGSGLRNPPSALSIASQTLE